VNDGRQEGAKRLDRRRNRAVHRRCRALRGVIHVLDSFVTRAAGGFQAFAAENRDIAAAVADQLALLQHARGFGDVDLLGC